MNAGGENRNKSRLLLFIYFSYQWLYYCIVTIIIFSSVCRCSYFTSGVVWVSRGVETVKMSQIVIEGYKTVKCCFVHSKQLFLMIIKALFVWLNLHLWKPVFYWPFVTSTLHTQFHVTKRNANVNFIIIFLLFQLNKFTYSRKVLNCSTTQITHGP